MTGPRLRTQPATTIILKPGNGNTMDKIFGEMSKKERVRLGGVATGVSFGLILLVLNPEGWWAAIIIGGLLAFGLYKLLGIDEENEAQQQRISRRPPTSPDGAVIDEERLRRGAPRQGNR
jgi:hypothetical protein